VFDDQDVAGLEAEAVSAQGGEEFVGERVSGEDFVLQRDGNKAEFIRGCTREFLLPLRG
jgi:hypothetical protein